eukprot:gene32779-36497_t
MWELSSPSPKFPPAKQCWAGEGAVVLTNSEVTPPVWEGEQWVQCSNIGFDRYATAFGKQDSWYAQPF